jgi:hypothetical protein
VRQAARNEVKYGSILPLKYDEVGQQTTRILFIVSQSPDYLEDFIYGGLCELLGPANVVDFPSKERFHIPNAPCQRPAVYGHPRAADYSPADLIDLAHTGFFSAILVGSLRPDALDAARSIFAALNRRPVTAFLDGEDQDSLHWQDLHRELGPEAIDLYFKREYKSWMSADSRIVPLPFPCPDICMPTIDVQEKIYDVCWLGFPNSYARKLMGEKLGELNGYRIVQDFSPNLNYVDYSQTLSRSKIGLSFGGAGFDTLRYWEIPYWDTMLLSEEPSIIIPDNFRHEESAVFCNNDLSDLVPLIHHYLREDEERSRIAHEGRRVLLESHTLKARAKYLLDVLQAFERDRECDLRACWLPRTDLRHIKQPTIRRMASQEGASQGEYVLSSPDKRQGNSMVETEVGLAALRVQSAIRFAELGISKLDEKALGIDGYSSAKVRHFLNNLCDFPNTRYLEVGLYKGSTFCSALAGNNIFAVGIDNWADYGGTRAEFEGNLPPFVGDNRVQILNEDSLTVDLESVGRDFDIFFYDGDHSVDSHRVAMLRFCDVCKPVFIAIVDDWNHDRTKEGVRQALDLLDCDVVYQRELPAAFNGDTENWWNGVLVAIIRQRGA